MHYYNYYYCFVSWFCYRRQEKSNNARRLQDAFSLMNDILTSKPSLHHKPSFKPTNRNGMFELACNDLFLLILNHQNKNIN